MNSENIKLSIGYVITFAICSTILAAFVILALSLALITASFLMWEWLPNLAIGLVIIRVGYALAFLAMLFFMFKDHRGFMEIVESFVGIDGEDED